MNRFFALWLISLVYLAACAAASVAKPTCGGSTSSKDIQLLTPAYPPRECAYHIKAYSSYVCQLRIDFAMTLAEPSVPASNNDLTYAQCVNDYFEVGNLHLCGIETKQHIYVPFNRTAGVTLVDLSIVLADRAGNTGLPTPSWDIRITQLECPTGAAIRELDFEASPEDIKPSMRATFKDGFFVAPPGCLQYFPQQVGVVTSFNYNLGKGIYPGNMDYAICFRRQTDTDALELRALVFHLGAASGANNQMELDNNCYSNLRTAGRSEDYVMIPQATILYGDVRATYFCGDSIDGDTVRSTNPGPLMMLFNSDGQYSQNEAGFYFTYKVV